MRPFYRWLGLGALLLPLVAQGAVMVNTERAELPRIVDDDLYVANGAVSISSEVRGDVFAAGQRVNLSGAVRGDIMAAGENVTVTGPAADDVRLAGREVTVAGTIGDDLLAAGQIVNLDPKITIGGDIYAAGSQVRIGGTIAGTVRAAGEIIEILPGTRIAGDLITRSGRQPIIGSDVVISGARRHTDEHLTAARRSVWLIWVRSIVMWFVLAAILIYLVPRLTAAALKMGFEAPGRTILTGVGWLFLAGPVSVLLLVSGLGTLVGIALLLLTALLLILSLAQASLIVGRWALQRFVSDAGPLTWQHALVGALIIHTVRFIPVVGSLTVAVLVVLAFGSMLRAGRNLVRPA